MKITAADIGGTNSRFAHLEFSSPDRYSLTEECSFKTNDSRSFEGLIGAVEKTKLGRFEEWGELVVLAIPGPIQDDSRATLANVEWPIDVSSLKNRCPDKTVYVINDFTAQVVACLTSAVSKDRLVRPGVFDPRQTIAAVGAGTGLGHCALRQMSEERYVTFPAEAGHCAFPFVDALEDRYREFLLTKTGEPFATGDMVVSGQGLANLHHYLTGDTLEPEEVAQTIDNTSVTAQWFARFYARSCRQYALNVLPMGGLFLSGGIAVKNPWIVENDAFREEFVNSIKKRELLELIPVFLNTNNSSSLYGSAHYGLIRSRL